MKRHSFIQGSAEWHAHRATARNASEAPAMLGCSPYMTRAELLQVRHTGLRRDPTASEERIFAEGHIIEAAQRPAAAAIIGEELYPVTGSEIVDGIELSASFDGLTMAEDVGYECKTLNDDLRAALPMPGPDGNDAANLPKHYQVQMAQQLMVCGGERVLFVAATKDGSDVRRCWYYPDAALRAEILAAWRQFDTDLAAYVPTEIKERPAAEVTLALPALVIHAKGEITTSNMKEYGDALAKRLAEVRAIALVTDQDFSNAKESAKLLRENIQQAKLAKEQMLAQTVTVGEAARLIDTWCEDMRLTALKLEQDVEREDKAKKAAMIAKAKADYEAHIEALKADTGGPWIVLQQPDWPGAIKGKRNFASMQDALDTMLANAKIVGDESARKIRAALACMAEEGKGYEFLLNDRLTHIGKPVEDVRTLVRARITEHRAAEERRAAELAERERARIRAEEEARAQRRADVQRRIDAIGTSGAPLEGRTSEELARIMRTLQTLTLTAEFLDDRVQEAVAARDQRLDEVDKARIAAVERENAAEQLRQQQASTVVSQPLHATPVAPQIQPSVTGNVHPAAAAGPAVIPMPTRAPAAPSVRIPLGEINKRLAVGGVEPNFSAAFLAALGFQPEAVERGSKLYDEANLPLICSVLAQHFAAVAGGQREAA